MDMVYAIVMIEGRVHHNELFVRLYQKFEGFRVCHFLVSGVPLADLPFR
jgi:hypothetical protein